MSADRVGAGHWGGGSQAIWTQQLLPPRHGGPVAERGLGCGQGQRKMRVAGRYRDHDHPQLCLETEISSREKGEENHAMGKIPEQRLCTALISRGGRVGKVP